MQVNRLNLIFPPGTPSPASTAPAVSEALLPESDKAPSAASRQSATPSRPATAPAEPSPAASPVASGVTLELGSAQKAAAGGVYTRDGVLAGRTVATSDQTPAEQFVASAVHLLRDFDASTMTLGSPSATDASTAPQTLSGSRFGSLRQAVSKLNVFA